MTSLSRIHETVIQCEETKRLLLVGDIPRLRLAVILLDNAAELILRRAAEDDLRRGQMYHQMLQTAQPRPHDPGHAEWRANVAANAVSPQQQKQIRRYFQPKVDFLVARGRLAPANGRALQRLHFYRNEIQHRDTIRRESIYSVALIFYDLVCELLATVADGGLAWSSAEDHSWLEQYGQSLSSLDSARLRSALAAKLREGLEIDNQSTRRTLLEHLKGRIDAMENELAFTASTGSRLGGDPATVLKAIQYWEEYPASPPVTGGPAFDAFSPTYTIDSFQEWRSGFGPPFH